LQTGQEYRYEVKGVIVQQKHAIICLGHSGKMFRNDTNLSVQFLETQLSEWQCMSVQVDENVLIRPCIYMPP
jgi:hypothetical protein